MGHPATPDPTPTGDAGSRRIQENDDLVSTDDKGLREPATHSARNAGSGVYRAILLEKKWK